MSANKFLATGWDKDISGYSGAKAGTYLRTLYDDWLADGRLDLILADIHAKAETQLTLAEIEASTKLALKEHLVNGDGDITPPPDIGIWDYLNAPVGSIPTNPTLQCTWTDAKAAFLNQSISAPKTLTAAERTAIQAKILSDGTPFAGADIAEIKNDNHHETKVYPAGSNLTCTFTAGGVADIFGSWVEIVDSAANKLSDAFTLVGGYVSSVVAEDSSVKDKVYYIEIAYGPSKTVVGRTRFISATNKLNHTAQHRMRTLEIPAGKTVYYRMMCETASATCVVHIRHYAS